VAYTDAITYPRGEQGVPRDEVGLEGEGSQQEVAVGRLDHGGGMAPASGRQVVALSEYCPTHHCWPQARGRPLAQRLWPRGRGPTEDCPGRGLATSVRWRL
jgi:hypothetical protein